MSVYASAWAREVETGSPMAKCLLFALAEYASHDGVCYPSHRTLARVTEMSPGSVKAHLKRLVDAHLIEVVAQTRPDGSQTSNAYRLIGYIASAHYHRMIAANASLDEGAAPEPSDHQMPARGQETGGEGVAPIPEGGTRAGPLESPIRITHKNQEDYSGSLEDADSILGRAARVIVQVRGLHNVDPAVVADHMATVLASMGRADDDPALIPESLRFREYWNARRSNYPAGRAWRSQDWHRALTNWLTRYAERADRPEARSATPGRQRRGLTTVDRSLENLRRVMAAVEHGGES